MQYYRDLPLRWVAVVIAALLAIIWIGGLLWTGKFRRTALKFPRSIPAGIVLLTISAVWCSGIVAQAGDQNLLVPKPVGYAMIWGLCIGSVVWRLEFMAVRALAVLLLLVAKVIVDAAFTVQTPACLVMTILAYLWVIAAMWWAWAPWRLRNALEWTMSSDQHCKMVSGVHLAIAALLIVLAFAAY